MKGGQDESSNCCGIEAGECEDYGICPRCKEHCGWEEWCEMCKEDYKDCKCDNTEQSEHHAEHYTDGRVWDDDLKAWGFPGYRCNPLILNAFFMQIFVAKNH